MESMHKLKEMLFRELEQYSRKGELSAGSLEAIHKLTDTIKNIDKIEMLEEYGEGDESYEGGNSGAGRRGTYVGGYYRRGRGSSRESGGSYGGESYGGGSYESGESYDGGSYRGGGGNSGRRGGRGSSRDDGKEHMKHQLREMMEEAGSEREREAIRKCLEQLE